MRLWDCLLVFFHGEKKDQLIIFMYLIALSALNILQPQLLECDLNHAMAALQKHRTDIDMILVGADNISLKLYKKKVFDYLYQDNI
jgi:hypothetical protein